MGDAMAGIQETRQEAIDNWIEIMKDSAKFDHELNLENEKYQKECRQGLRPC